MSENSDCPFCALPDDRVLSRRSGWMVVRDGYPVAAGHTLLIVDRHVQRIADLTPAESAAMVAVIAETQRELSAEFGVTDFTVGINDGPLAGQTVPHLHVHVIPRVADDVADPRGGVRWVIPDLADYWNSD